MFLKWIFNESNKYTDVLATLRIPKIGSILQTIIQ